jgi:hypothetical protein
VAVNVEQVECEIGEAVRLPAGNRVIEQIQMCDAALTGHGDLAVEQSRRRAPPRGTQLPACGMAIKIAARDQNRCG